MSASHHSQDHVTRVLWEKATRRTTYLDDPAEYEGQVDLYVHAGYVPVTFTHARRRPKARDIIGIPGVWLDVDVVGGPEHKTGAAPSRDAALELATSVLAPSVLVSSGYGLQAWHLFADPWIFGLPAEREQAARILKGWERLHRAHANERGWNIDPCADLARLMRLPGTLNGKDADNPVPVTLLYDDGPRYDLDTIAERALTAIPTAPPSPPTPVDLAPVDKDLLDRKLQILLEGDSFRRTWNHTRPDARRKLWSCSQYDLAVACYLVDVGLTDSEIASLISRHQDAHGTKPGKAHRQDYLARTVAKARNRRAGS